MTLPERFGCCVHDGIRHAAAVADQWNRAVAHAVNRNQTTGFESRGVKNHVGAGEHTMGELLVIAADCYPAGVPLREFAEIVLVTIITFGDEHELCAVFNELR